MSRNGSGTYSLPAGNPVVTGTTISSTWANNTLNDIATALTQSIASDGQTTPTANLPMGTFKLTGLGVGSAADDSLTMRQTQYGAMVLLGSITGTNTITGALLPPIPAYATGQTFRFVPANTNTGATTINIDTVGAKNIFCGGAACVGGELRQNVPVEIFYDGTQFNIIGPGFTWSSPGAIGGTTPSSVTTTVLNVAFGSIVSVSTSATSITTTAYTVGARAYVTGAEAGNTFGDFVYYTDSMASALASHTVSGAPSARTYTAVGGILKLQMASGTYSVRAAQEGTV